MNPLAIRKYFQEHQLVIGIGLAITIALLLTAVNVSLYIRSGASRLDLSRPGYEDVRDRVTNNSEEDNFSATGPMDTSVANEFQAIYSKQRANLNALDPFSPTVLDNDSIRLLSPEAQPE